MSGGAPVGGGAKQPGGGAYAVLLLVTVVAAAGGVVTLLPAAGASYPNILGYRSLCTFAPAASLYCFLIAGVTCALRATLVKRRRIYGKTIVNKGAMVFLAIVLAAAVASTAWFIVEKRTYTQADTTSAASEES